MDLERRFKVVLPFEMLQAMLLQPEGVEVTMPSHEGIDMSKARVLQMEVDSDRRSLHIYMEHEDYKQAIGARQATPEEVLQYVE